MKKLFGLGLSAISLFTFTACDDEISDSGSNSDIHSVTYTLEYDNVIDLVMGKNAISYHFTCSNIMTAANAQLVTNDISGTEQAPLDFYFSEFMVIPATFTLTDDNNDVTELKCGTSDGFNIYENSSYDITVSFDQDSLYSTINSRYRLFYGNTRTLEINEIEEANISFSVEFPE